MVRRHMSALISQQDNADNNRIKGSTTYGFYNNVNIRLLTLFFGQ